IESLDELLAGSDVISLHCPLTPETHHLIDARRLAVMQPSAHLVNTTRGPVVDEAALVDALRAGTIGGAGLDVFEHEPHVHPGLLELEQAVLLPHLGSATIETRTAMAMLAARNAIAVLAGGPQRPTISIAAGTLDEPTGLRVERHIFVADAADWEALPHDNPGFTT